MAAGEQTLEDLLSEVGELSSLQQAKVAAILGAVVADAAIQPIHWIYDPPSLEKAVSKCPEAPEFLPVSANPFYCIATGNQSLYGDQLMTTLESIAECKGFDPKNVAEKMFRDFGPNSPYDQSNADKYKQQMKEKSVYPKTMYPIHGKWQTFQLRRFAKCYSEGVTVESLKEEDSNLDPDTIIRNIPLIALLAGKPELLSTLQESVLLTQTNDMMVAIVLSVGRLIEHYILNGSAEVSRVSPLDQVILDLKDPSRRCPNDLDLAMAKHYKDVLEHRGLSVRDASVKFGVSCNMPGSVQSTVHALLGGSDYVATVRSVALAGGCNCSRVSVVGACLGARFGMEAIPMAWLEKTDAAKRALTLALQLAKL